MLGAGFDVGCVGGATGPASAMWAKLESSRINSCVFIVCDLLAVIREGFVYSVEKTGNGFEGLNQLVRRLEFLMQHDHVNQASGILLSDLGAVE